MECRASTHERAPDDFPSSFPPQHQNWQPGLEYRMHPRPVSERCTAGRKLEGKTALITGGDSGIGRSVAYAFAREGANIAIVYYNEDRDAAETAERLQQMGCSPLMMRGDLKKPGICRILRQKDNRTLWETGYPDEQSCSSVYPSEHSGHFS